MGALSGIRSSIGERGDAASATGSAHAKLSEILSRLPSAGLTGLQYGTITISNGNSSNTATITSVDTSKSSVIFLGSSISADPSVENYMVRLALTNATTVTATRNGTTNNLIVSFVVVTWTNSVSVQAGTIAFLTDANATKTATISSVDTTRSILFWLGIVEQAAAVSKGQTRITLTDATTVTATRGVGDSSADTTVGFVVVEF